MANETKFDAQKTAHRLARETVAGPTWHLGKKPVRDFDRSLAVLRAQDLGLSPDNLALVLRWLRMITAVAVEA